MTHQDGGGARVLLFLLVLAVTTMPQTTRAEQVDDPYQPLIDRGFAVERFTVAVEDRRLPVVIASPPPQDLADDPVLLLTIGGPTSHLLPPNDLPALYFLERGHRAVSFPVGTMPGSLELYCDTVLEGPDPTLMFIQNAEAVIDACVERGWARRGRVVVTGISRYGYLALRLMAADDSLNIGGGFSPVTDWRYLREFHGHESDPHVTALGLSNFVDQLTGKKIYLAIGNHDDRVSTQSCCELFVALNKANTNLGYGHERLDFFVTPSPGHTLADEWYERGMAILLDAATASQPDSPQ